MKNIVLIGFMDSGKSVTARILAEILKREVVSTDQLIEQKEKRGIPEIFNQSGEEYFRQVERRVVEELSNREGVIIDCGGGVVTVKENLTSLKKNGILIHLAASVDLIYERVSRRTNRPLLNVPDPKAKIKELLQERRASYDEADITVDTDNKSAKQVCSEIIPLIKSVL